MSQATVCIHYTAGLELDAPRPRGSSLLRFVQIYMRARLAWLSRCARRRGTEYVTDVLVGWLYDAAVAWRVAHRPDMRSASRASTTSSLRAASPAPLPVPLSPLAAHSPQRTAACYLLHSIGFAGFPRGRPLQAVPWHTAHCAKSISRRADAAARALFPAVSGGSTAGMQAKFGAGPSWLQRAVEGCSEVDAVHRCTPSVEVWKGVLPRVWLFCLNSQSVRNPKRSPGVNAYVPGATLFLPLRPIEASAADGGAVQVSIKHLVSYKHMGVAALTCLHGCTCEAQRIDASWDGRHGSMPAYRNLLNGRNVSAHMVFSLVANVTRAEVECVVVLRVLQRTSSGGHRFVVKDVSMRVHT
eukprot:6860938-Prymnesium_polylepis.2